jgi:iron complex outermembrane recepter protein
LLRSQGRERGRIRKNGWPGPLLIPACAVWSPFAFVDIPKSYFRGVDQTRITFRVKNLTNKLYAAWGDPGYTDQIILGAPRSYEVAASFRW